MIRDIPITQRHCRGAVLFCLFDPVQSHPRPTYPHPHPLAPPPYSSSSIQSRVTLGLGEVLFFSFFVKFGLWQQDGMHESYRNSLRLRKLGVDEEPSSLENNGTSRGAFDLLTII
ncbi:hypothetical protein L484_019378 [Morus notabilis]|uniref:Uncharacterized protein n=1 Tax=Morus notabilis TaxID=981085 RepID=W9S7W1_9ROSA|nr:hypothetical protein L484_019378 [Morus notabilis]